MNSLKNVSYTLISNIISTLISVIVTFILPKFLGSVQYGYFQLYTFYVGYVIFLNFGLTEGILLRYGGAYYDKLEYARFKGQLIFLLVTQFFVAGVITILAVTNVSSAEKKWVFIFIAASTVFTGIRTYFHYILQGTNRIKEYSMIIIVDKLTYIALAILFIILRLDSFVPYIFSYTAGLFVACIAGAVYCREIICSKSEQWKSILFESWENMRVGIKLVIASSAGMLIIGVIRQGIEYVWNVQTFGKVSLTLSVSNMLVLLINAVSIVLFPTLRRMDSDKIEILYGKMRDLLMIILLILLAFYYPGKVILGAWLPEYADSLKYMAMLFPMCLYESKMSMLVNTYLKTMRKEKIIMMVNLGTVCLSFVMCAVTVFWLKNLNLAILSIIILLAFRCVVAELILSTIIHINVRRDIVIELGMTAIFIMTSWYIGGVKGLLLYIICLGIYLSQKRKAIQNIIGMLKNKFV